MKHACGDSCSCKSPPLDPYLENIRVLWRAPTEYDAAKHGPPYLPKASNTKTASDEPPEMSALLVLLAYLQTASLVHQTHHWSTKGGLFYGDHLLFERLYTESQDFIDQVAERAVGSGAEAKIVALDLLKQMMVNLQVLPSSDMVGLSLCVEQECLRLISTVLQRLEGESQLTPGISNLLEGLADKHESFVYLLNQRNGGYKYDR